MQRAAAGRGEREAAPEASSGSVPEPTAIDRDGWSAEDRRWLQRASALVAGAAGAVWVFLFWGSIYDDSYIIYRYAGRLADGDGLRWNVDGAWQFGSTSVVWPIIGAVADLVGIAPETAMPIVGALAWAVLVVVVAPRLVATVTDRRWAAIAGVAAIAAAPALGLHSLTGLETAAAALVAAGGLWAALQGRWTLLAALTVAGVLTRPDLLLVFGILWAGSLLFAGWPLDRRVLAAGGLAALGVVLVAALCWLLFATPVPNSYYVKSDPGRRGLDYVLDVVPLLAPLVLPVAVALVTNLRATVVDRALWLAGLPAVLFVASYVRVDPLLGQQHRFFVPILALLVVAAVRAAALVPRARLGTAALAVALLVSGVQQARSAADERAAVEDYFGAIDARLVPLGEALAEAAPGASLGTAEAGAMPYYSDLPTVDLIGLNDLDIARDGLSDETMDPSHPTVLALQDVFVTSEPGPTLVADEPEQGAIYLDDEAYAGARPYTGRATSRFVLQREGFAEDYRHVASIGFGETDRFEIFVLRDEWEANAPLVAAVRGLPFASPLLGADVGP